MRKNGLLKKALAIALSVSMVASSGVVAFAEGADEISFFDEDVVVEQADQSADEALFEVDGDFSSDEASFEFVEEDSAWEDDGLAGVDFGSSEDVSYQSIGEDIVIEDATLVKDKEVDELVEDEISEDLLSNEVIVYEAASYADPATTVNVTIADEGSTSKDTTLNVTFTDSRDDLNGVTLAGLFSEAGNHVKDNDVIQFPGGNIYFKAGGGSEVNIYKSVTINGDTTTPTILHFCGTATSNDRCIRIQPTSNGIGGNGPTVNLNNITIDGTDSTKQASAFYVKHSKLYLTECIINNFGDNNAIFLNARDHAYNKYKDKTSQSITEETMFDSYANAKNVTFVNTTNAVGMEVYPSDQIKICKTHAKYEYEDCTYNDTKIAADGYAGHKNAISTEIKAGVEDPTDLLPAVASVTCSTDGYTMYYPTLHETLDKAREAAAGRWDISEVTVELLDDIHFDENGIETTDKAASPTAWTPVVYNQLNPITINGNNKTIYNLPAALYSKSGSGVAELTINDLTFEEPLYNTQSDYCSVIMPYADCVRGLTFNNVNINNAMLNGCTTVFRY